jgi:hypothetical protein
MENNPLLEVLNTPKNRVYDVTDNYLRHVSVEDFKAHIHDLLEKQRIQSAQNYVNNQPTGVLKWVRQSIINDKII